MPASNKDYKMIFGWEGDNGLGELLIQQIIEGRKTATCAPKEQYSAEELKEVYEPIGEVLSVCDKQGNIRCRVRLHAVIETTFGKPDSRLVRGEGNGEDVKQFQEDHRIAWADSGIDLNDNTILVAELFELVGE
ncbi:ASCH domain-containing protein [Paenibacillus tarimensis]|uniref:ASCH domain-containing protein n=1 Tax=Paenibacillus tarimensis TaxID=416012 RepID=UPI001F35C16A|nr:ASCH domain-containing protein [Paenibacillus tarimensis]MCF2946306.1 ASCH domain-containing protein [Paenibacillus tarimensis]